MLTDPTERSVAAHRWHRRWLISGWLMIAAVIVLSLIPGPPNLDIAQGDKLQHLAGYCFLMLWFAQIYRECRSRIAWALGLVIMGIALEALQGMTSWRSYDLYDMAANTTGVLLGWMLAPPRGPDLYGRVTAWFVPGH